jgi:hypothetical protein
MQKLEPPKTDEVSEKKSAIKHTPTLLNEFCNY